MSFLLDTCTVSEPLKRSPDQGLTRWLSGQSPESLYLSVVTLGEARKGIEQLPEGVRKQGLPVNLWE